MSTVVGIAGVVVQLGWVTDLLAVCGKVVQEDLVQVFVYLECTTLCAFFEEEVRNTDETMEFVRTKVVLVSFGDQELVVKLFWMVNEGTTNELGEIVMVAASLPLLRNAKVAEDKNKKNVSDQNYRVTKNTQNVCF